VVPHGRHERAVSRDYFFGPYSHGEGDVKRIVGAVIDDEADLHCQIVQFRACRGSRRHLSAQKTEDFMRFIRREQFSAHLQPQDVACFVQPEVGNQQAHVASCQLFGLVAVRFLQHPLEADGRIHDKCHVSGRRLPATVTVHRATAPTT